MNPVLMPNIDDSRENGESELWHFFSDKFVSWNPTNIRPRGSQVRIPEVPSPKHLLLMRFQTFIKPGIRLFHRV